jgi:hypothetical protein
MIIGKHKYKWCLKNSRISYHFDFYFRQQPLEHWKNMELDHVVLEDSMELWVSSSIRTLKLRHKPTSLMLGLWSEINIFNSYPWVFKASFIFVFTDYQACLNHLYIYCDINVNACVCETDLIPPDVVDVL